jgi:stage III sporulation protein AC
MMDVGLILRVAGVGILVAVAAQILSKSGRDEQAMLVTVAGLVVVFLILVQEIGNLFDTVRAVFGF